MTWHYWVTYSLSKYKYWTPARLHIWFCTWYLCGRYWLSITFSHSPWYFVLLYWLTVSIIESRTSHMQGQCLTTEPQPHYWGKLWLCFHKDWSSWSEKIQACESCLLFPVGTSAMCCRGVYVWLYLDPEISQHGEAMLVGSDPVTRPWWLNPRRTSPRSLHSIFFSCCLITHSLKSLSWVRSH